MDYTPRLQLPKPSLVGEVIDPAMLRDMSDKLDANANLTICTSVTKPGAPFNGQRILLTDTKEIQVYITGVGWCWDGGPSTAFRRYQNAGFSVATANTLISFDTSHITPAIGDASIPQYARVGQTGTYRLAARVGWLTNAAGAMDATIEIQVSTDSGGIWNTIAYGEFLPVRGLTANPEIGLMVDTLWPMTKDALVRVQVYQSGSATTGVVGYHKTYFEGHRVA